MAGITELSFLIESWCLLSDKRKTGDSRRIDKQCRYSRICKDRAIYNGKAGKGLTQVLNLFLALKASGEFKWSDPLADRWELN